MAEDRPAPDPLTAATVTIAWVIALNKPFYPVYVWYLVGNGVVASLATMLAAPLFLAIPYLARRNSLAARLALPLVGTLDTVFETKIFGAPSGTALFLAPCAMLVALGLRSKELWWQRGMIALIFAAFLVAHLAIGEPLHVWQESDLAILRNLNIFAVASLIAFIGLRYAGASREDAR